MTKFILEMVVGTVEAAPFGDSLHEILVICVELSNSYLNLMIL